MLKNPLSNPLFWPVVIRIAGLLAGGLLIVVALERKAWRDLKTCALFLRVKAWLFIAPVFVLGLFVGGFVLFLLGAFIALQGASEYVRLTGIKRRYAFALVAWILIGLLVAALARRYFLFLPLGFFMVLTLVPIIAGDVKGAHRQVTGTLFGYLYIGLPMAYFVFIKAQETWGLEFLLVVGTAVALSDIMAFVVGSIAGGPRLAPAVSPGKTWFGTVGNLLGAAAAIPLLWVALPKTWSPAILAVLVFTVALGAIWGDLTESFIKRDFAVKDTGTLLPGFGGILDRVDSLLLTLPLSYYALLAAGKFMG